jgi:acyl-CoA synthetase (NDP forming)
VTDTGVEPPHSTHAGSVERVANPLERVYRPRSVAVVGASDRVDSLGGQTLTNLIKGGFKGAIYPVNPRHNLVAGLKAYSSVRELPEHVDLVIVLAPAEQTMPIIAECVEANASAVVICSAGFGETGTDGERAQREIVAAARASGLRVIGPNCQGLMYFPSRLIASFSAAFEGGVGGLGGVAYVGQSGALGGAFYSLAHAHGIGVNAWFSLGNQADLTVCELGIEMLGDETVRVLALHLEQLPQGVDFEALLRTAAFVDKSLVVLRGGSSDAGRRAIASHTGAMVADDRAFELLVDRYGAIRVSDVDELVYSVAQALTGRRLRGSRVAVVTSSGGAGALAADWLSESVLTLTELKKETRDEIARFVPAFGSTMNPVDVTAQLFAGTDHKFEHVCESLLADDNVDALLVVLTNLKVGVAEHVASGLIGVASRTEKPVVTAWLSAQGALPGAGQLLEKAHLIPHTSVREAVATLERLARAEVSRLDRQGVVRALDGMNRIVEEIPVGPAVLLEYEGAAILEKLGVAHPKQIFVQSTDAVSAAVEAVGGRAVLKIRGSRQGVELIHKSDVNGLLFDVTPSEAESSYRHLIARVNLAVPDLEVIGVLVQEQMPPGLELLVGVTGHSNGYPPIVSLAAGGVMAELYAEVASGLAPISVSEAIELLRRLRVWSVLAGYRGSKELDYSAAASAVSALSFAAAELGERLLVFEINPLIVYENGVCAADFLMELAQTSV